MHEHLTFLILTLCSHKFHRKLSGSLLPIYPTRFSVFRFTGFTVLVHFQFDGKGYTFTRLCQGYTESPSIYNAALCDSLVPLQLTEGTALLQNVDDLMICSPNQGQCKKDTLSLLCYLADEGHKATLSSLSRRRSHSWDM